MQEFFVLRKNLYERRKEFMLAKLLKEFETISNKVRFILCMISEEIKISRVKRGDVVKRLKEMGFKTHSQLNEILPEKKKATLKNEGSTAEAGENNEELVANEASDEALAGGIPMKEYDYLLSMPMMNLTEERVAELQRLLKEKKKEYDALEHTHIFEIWEKDLDKFLYELEQYEAKEEADR